MRRSVLNLLILATVLLGTGWALAVECYTPLTWQHKLRDTPLDADGNFVADGLQDGEDHPRTVIVDLMRCPQPSDIARLEALGDVIYAGRHVTFLIMQEVDPADLETLAMDPVVAFVEQNTIPEPTLEISRKVVGTDLIETTYGLLGSGINIAVMDTGVDDGVHVGLPPAAFVGGMDCTPCSCAGSGDACFSDFDCPVGDSCECSCYASGDTCTTNGDCPPGDYCEAYPACVVTNPDDDLGHGTHVASIALGRGGGDCPDCKGIAPAAGLVDVKVFSAERTAFLASLLVAFEELLDRRELWDVRRAQHEPRRELRGFQRDRCVLRARQPGRRGRRGGRGVGGQHVDLRLAGRDVARSVASGGG